MNSPARFKVVACGRRWGKTALGMNLILHSALVEKKRCWWLTPTHQMSAQVWRDLKTSTKPLNGSKISETERRIDLPGGGMIAVRSAFHPDNLRGEGLDLVVLDEAAFMPPQIWTDIVRPMLVSTRGQALFLSTPNGQNWFCDLFNLGSDPLQPQWESFQFPTAANPLIHHQELQDIRRQTPDHVWQTEYMAQFVSPGGQVFRHVRDAVSTPPPKPLPGHQYVAGIDWGRDNDYTAIAVIDATTRQMVALDRFNQIGWSLQRNRLLALANHWQPHVIWAEINSIGEPNIEALIQEGLPIRGFRTTAQSKPPLIESLALALERGSLSLLDEPTLLAELTTYSQQRLPSGAFRYGAPPGAHDDTVIATALAWHAAQHSAMPLYAFA
ncbi:MAG: terminase family protein [Chloroflexi bacterium]|nr:terminase family protein [Chloroflexota bacterium]